MKMITIKQYIIEKRHGIKDVLSKSDVAYQRKSLFKYSNVFSNY